MINVSCAMGEFVDHNESDHENGFFCVLPAFRLSPPSGDRRGKNVVWFRCDRVTYRVTHSLGPNPGPSPEDLKIDKLASPAVLVSGTITREQGAIGALVNIKREPDSNGRTHAQYHTRVHVWVETLPDVLGFLANPDTVKDLLVEGKEMVAKDWCVY
jgi:hypothetical protein